ncbi:MAG: hypothetical protein QOF18_2684 [Frankiaceae bacterium]|nr:hypothetical protein [Frankiaceae bacterium]
MCPAAASQRPWWVELGAVLPRSVTFARDAARAGNAVPPLAANPLAWATVAVDELAMSAAYLIGRRGGERVTDEMLAATADAVARLRSAGVVDEPLLAHPSPGAPTEVRLSRRRRFGSDFEHLSYASGYVPAAGLTGAVEWDDEVANRTAHAYLLRADEQPRPWALVLHGHRMGEPRDLRLLGSLRLQHDLQVNVAHLVLPMHGPRGRDGGRPFPGVDPVRNFLGVSQAVWDARTLLGWLRAGGAETIGVFGVSLGGHVAAMLAGLDTALAGVVAGVPTADLSTMLADTVRAHWGEEAVAASHVLDDASRTLSRLASPLSFAPRLPVDRRFLYAAVGDRLVTPQQALALWQHWERPTILWLQGGHIANNVGASRRFVSDAFIACGVAGVRAGAQ